MTTAQVQSPPCQCGNPRDRHRLGMGYCRDDETCNEYRPRIEAGYETNQWRFNGREVAVNGRWLKTVEAGSGE